MNGLFLLYLFTFTIVNKVYSNSQPINSHINTNYLIFRNLSLRVLLASDYKKMKNYFLKMNILINDKMDKINHKFLSAYYDTTISFY